MISRGKTKPFRGESGNVRPGSIAEGKYIRLGGLDQWVLIRGESIANPALIVLHGGPGFSDTAFLRYFNAPLERSFTVVYWDQRGTGRSFSRSVPRSSMTVEQMVSDLDELVDYVCERLGREKVTILGHSWGSVLGVLYADRFPHKVAAYVGCAQIGNSAEAEAKSYAIALDKAALLHNRRALKQLRAMGPPPYDAKSVMKERTLLQRMDGQLRGKPLMKMIRMVLGAPDSSLFDLPKTVRGFWFTLDAMLPETSKINLVERVSKLEMPVFVFVGRKDHWVPAETSVDYFEHLSAPPEGACVFRRIRARGLCRRACQVQCTHGRDGAAGVGLSRVDAKRGRATLSIPKWEAKMVRSMNPFSNRNDCRTGAIAHLVVCFALLRSRLDEEGPELANGDRSATSL